MSLHPNLTSHLEARFSEFFKESLTLKTASSVHGGDINQCFRLETDKGSFFMKMNASIFGLDFFEKEARGLILLADTGTIRVPRPLFDGKFHQQVFLVMEALETGPPREDFWEQFGKSMAHLHRHTADHFGLDYPNYIGKLHQSNRHHESWAEFYTQERIMCNARKARDRNLLSSEDLGKAEKICADLSNRVPEEPPTLVHGDLWNANYLVQRNGMPAVFDPSVYYGHREMDLAMAQLFGGFDPAFFDHYQEVNPLEGNWQSRTRIFQLYPLLIHLLLFGGKYRQQVEEILAREA
jgi:fructosamine-3-kinase